MDKIEKREAIDNLRVAVKASLLIVPVPEYRAWAQLYLKTTEPRVAGLDSLIDWANDSIAHLAGWEPWTGPGRVRDCWFIIRDICEAHQLYSKGGYHNATMTALSAANKCLEVGRRSNELMLGFVQNLEMSLYGEAVS